MGTRGCIARMNGSATGFKGVYHHWDSNPDGLGKTLYGLYNGHFKRNLATMLKTLIDEHPAGWSTINHKDFNVKPGYNREMCYHDYIDGEEQFCARCGVDTQGIDFIERKNRPLCYCHGDRKEEAWEVTHENASDSGCEYAYVFDVKNKIMHVLSSYCSGDLEGTKMIGFFGSGDPNATWKPIGTVNLDSAQGLLDEEFWQKMEESE